MESDLLYLRENVENRTTNFMDIPDLFFDLKANEIYHINFGGTMMLLPDLNPGNSGSTTGVTYHEANPKGIKFKLIAPDSDVNVQFYGNAAHRESIKTGEIHELWSNNASTPAVCKNYEVDLNWSFTGLIIPKKPGTIRLKFRCVSEKEIAIIKKHSYFIVHKK